MKKILYVFGGPNFHPTEWAGQELTKLLAADGRFTLEMTRDLDAFTRLKDGAYASVIVFATGFKDDLTPAREKGLIEYVKNGGGFVGVHAGGADCFAGNAAYVEMLNGLFLTHPHVHDFTVNDEMYHLQKFDPARCRVLATTLWQGKAHPMAFVREQSKGRVAHLANGHTKQCWQHPEFRKLLVRSIAWTTGSELPNRTIRCGVLGYGPAFNMGKGHAEWMSATPGLKTVAMCDAVPARVEAAKKELPDLEGYFTKLDDMLAMKDLDLVVDILPHNLHASTALQCLRDGKHVVLEKPFCITVEEANDMIDTARAKKVMLSLFHNRRWDGDYLTIKDILARGLIGEIFHIECQTGNYSHPGFWWRSDKTVSGGVMYDWGAHFLDWILNLVPSKIAQVTGDFQKHVWHMVTNEDHGQAWIRFENGVTASFLVSQIAAIVGPKWRIHGTLGAIEANWGEEVTVVSFASGVRQDSKIKVTLPGYGTVQYYRNVADHLLMGEELIVKPEQARRVIGVIDAAQRSSAKGVSVAPALGCE
jgi:predicted dehydrogenase